MKIRLSSFLLLITFFLFSCSKDESPKPAIEQQEETNPDPDTNLEEAGPITYFTLISERPRAEGIINEWVVLHDEQGQLLDFRQFDMGDTLVFESETEVSDVINVTEVRYIQYDYGKNFTITTTTGVQKGSMWTFEANPVQDNFYQSDGAVGEFTFNIIRIPELEKMTVTNTKANLTSGYSSSTYPGPPPSTDLSTDINFYTGENEYYVSILDGLSQLKYYDFTYDNTDISVDYDDFKEFDAYHSVQLPENDFYIFNVAGFKENYPYSEQNGVVLHDVLSFPYPNVPTQPFVYGYLDIFNRYRTLLAITYKNLHYYHVQYGPKLKNIEIPDPTFTVEDPSKKNFRFNVDLDFVLSESLWSYSEGAAADNNLVQTYWYVKADNSLEPIVGDLPEEILMQYPEIKIEALEYQQTTLSLPMQSSEYRSKHTITIKKE